MTEGARRLRDTYAITPGAPLYKTEFGDGYFFGLERWKAEGMPLDADFSKLFDWNDRGKFTLGGCVGDNILVPGFPDELISETDSYLVRQDQMGRQVKYFKSCDHVYMPEFVGNAVTDRESWEKTVKPRLNPESPARYAAIAERVRLAKEARQDGRLISHEIDGGYMYLRDLFGPENLLYAFYESPDLIHEAMEAWLAVHDATAAAYQKELELDELFLKEDICYKTSSLISPAMMEEFLFPYYRRLIDAVRSRQNHDFYLAMDSDGHIESVIPYYYALGFRIFSPFEVAADCDVVDIGRRYPDIVLFGGIDKRVLAAGPEQIEEMLLRILPAMRKRGGYCPTCDHGVPEDVSYQNYLYFRRRVAELSDGPMEEDKP